MSLVLRKKKKRKRKFFFSMSDIINMTHRSMQCIMLFISKKSFVGIKKGCTICEETTKHSNDLEALIVFLT